MSKRWSAARIGVKTASVVAVLGLSVFSALVWSRTLGNAEFFRQPKALTGVVITYSIVALSAAALFVVLMNESLRPSLSASAGPGLMSGLLLVLHLLMERFVDLGKALNGVVTLSFMGSAFLLWALGGMRAARETSGMVCLAVAGAWSGLLGVICMTAAGVALELYFAVPDAASVAQWAEYQRSGWTNPQLFAIYNALDSADTAFFIAGFGGAVLGLAGGLISIHSRRHPQLDE